MPEVLLHPSVIERFTPHAPGLTGVARRTLRTNLRFLARRVVPQLDPADAAAAPRARQAPYSPAQIGGFLALADAQPTAARRMRAAGLVCLGAGAGLIRADLRDARGTDIRCRSGGVIVPCAAPPRVVPVLARYHARLLAAARFAGTGLICGGADPGRRNITSPLLTRAGRRDRPAPAGHLPAARDLAGRLRQLLGLATFMRAAGISCSQRLGDLAAGLEPGGEAEAVRLLGCPAMTALPASRRSSTPPAPRRGSRPCCPPARGAGS